MKLQINYKHLAAEFVIVVVGVAVALAADSWREELAEQRFEAEYLRRLSSDLEFGKEQLESQLNRFLLVQDSGLKMLTLLQNGNIENVDDFTTLYSFAARIGGNENNFSHDVTYRELISTGRLNIIRSPELRIAIAQYYNAVDEVKQNRAFLTKELLNRFMRITGYAPIDSDGIDLITSEARNQIASEFEQDPVAIRELREVIARTRRMEAAISPALLQNEQLSEVLLREL
ncbi:MAG: DUF6090 family protein [Gammaproteobacteria bacterium]